MSLRLSRRRRLSAPRRVAISAFRCAVVTRRVPDGSVEARLAASTTSAAGAGMLGVGEMPCQRMKTKPRWCPRVSIQLGTWGSVAEITYR